MKSNTNPLYSFFKKLVIFIVAISVGSFILWGAYILFDLLGVSVNVYGNYFLWGIAMGLFKLTLNDHYTESPWLKD